MRTRGQQSHNSTVVMLVRFRRLCGGYVSGYYAYSDTNVGRYLRIAVANASIIEQGGLTREMTLRFREDLSRGNIPWRSLERL